MMGAYICAICDKMYCHHEVPCYEYKPEDKTNTELVCEDCQTEREEEE